MQNMLSESLGGILTFWPVWAPAALLYIAFHTWIRYKQREWIKAQGGILLEIKLPNELFKSPVAMEIFLQSLHQAGVGVLTDVYLKGRVRSWFSLELISDGGKVHFYIWMHAKWKKLVETQLYAHFPNIEVHEAPDYALAIKYDPVKYKFGKMTHIVLTKADAYPIKTYIDYNLHTDPKEEFKNDPIVPMLEFLGSLKAGEHAWVQILIQAHAKEGLKYLRLTSKPDWKTAAEKEIKNILSKAKFKGAGEEKGTDPKFLSEAQKDAIKAIERSIEKNAFDAMIRAFYFAEQEMHNSNNIGGLLSAFKQFSSQTLNGFRPGWGADYDYPWQDFKNLRRRKNEKQMLEAYKRRAIFNTPFKDFKNKPYILTTEEVATLYHFPSAEVAATPTLARLPSKKAEAPANLPV